MGPNFCDPVRISKAPPVVGPQPVSPCFTEAGAAAPRCTRQPGVGLFAAHSSAPSSPTRPSPWGRPGDTGIVCGVCLSSPQAGMEPLEPLLAAGPCQVLRWCRGPQAAPPQHLALPVPALVLENCPKATWRAAPVSLGDDKARQPLRHVLLAPVRGASVCDWPESCTAVLAGCFPAHPAALAALAVFVQCSTPVPHCSVHPPSTPIRPASGSVHVSVRPVCPSGSVRVSVRPVCPSLLQPALPAPPPQLPVLQICAGCQQCWAGHRWETHPRLGSCPWGPLSVWEQQREWERSSPGEHVSRVSSL